MCNQKIVCLFVLNINVHLAIELAKVTHFTYGSLEFNLKHCQDWHPSTESVIASEHCWVRSKNKNNDDNDNYKTQ